MTNKKILTLVFVVAFLTLLVGCIPNRPPVITSDPVTTATVGKVYTYNVDATDPNAGDVLTYSLITEPDGMLINGTNGVITWTPDATGKFGVTVEASDGALSDTQSFTITVSEPPPVNKAPIIYSDPITTATIGVLYIYNVNAIDPDGDTLTYFLTTSPKGMTIKPATGLIKWTPKVKGNYAVVVKVSDGALSDTQNFTITVSAVEPELTEIKINPDTMTLLIRQRQPFTVTAHYSDGTIDKITSDCKYQSSDEGVATVVAGEISAVAKGTATITVTYADMTDTIEVTVDPIRLTSIVVEPETMLFLGEKSEPQTIESVTAHYNDGSKASIALSACDYQSSNENVATVIAGEISAVGLGTATITVSYTEEEITRAVLIKETDTVEVTVGPVHNITANRYYYTITKAIKDAWAGDIIEVAAGTYNEEVLIDKQLTLLGANASESIIDGGKTTAVTISANDVIVDGFTLDGGITLDDRANPISGGTISNNIITGADNPETTPPKAANGIRLGWDDGIGVDYITIENNIIKNSLCKGIRFASPRANVIIPTPGNSYITIRNNEIKDNGSAGMETYGSGPNTITGNTISGNNGNGINLKFDDGDVVTGNIITNNTGPGITLRQVINSIVENNSISGHQSSEEIKSWPDVIGGKGSGIHIMMVSEGNTIRFNDVNDNNYGFFIHSKDDSLTLQPSDNSINFNNIYGNNTYGILNDLVDPPKPVDAEDNWWGDASGPSDMGPGTGDAISAFVDYIPWSTSPY